MEWEVCRAGFSLASRPVECRWDLLVLICPKRTRQRRPSSATARPATSSRDATGHLYGHVSTDSPDKIDVLGVARDLAPLVAAASDEIDRERELPPRLFGELLQRGFFRLLLPRSLDGLEIDYLEFLQIVRTFAEADGSAAWCLNQNNVFSTVSAFMPEGLAQEIWGDRRAVVANGPPTAAEAVSVDGGYRLTGRWNFSSGSRHATWLAAAVPIDGPYRGLGPESGANSLMMLLPKKEVDLVDAWQVNGLRGTGSFSFQVQDHFVPEARTYRAERPRETGPLYVMPTSLLFASGFASVALGVARAGLDAAIELAKAKRPRDRGVLRDDPVVQRQVGQAEALWGSARALLTEAASAAWKDACETRTLTLEERIRLRLSSTHAIRMSADVVDVAYGMYGSDAIFEGSAIQRRFQDAHVITQQIQGRMAHYETAGQFFLGQEPQGSF